MHSKSHRSFAAVILAAALLPPLWAFPQAPAPSVPLIKPVVNRDYLPVVLKMIAGAKKTIDFIQLEFHYDPTVRQIQDALREAVRKGVKVRGLIENEIRFNQTSEKYLNQFGIETKLDTPQKMTHSKLFIADGEKVLLGSTNLSANSIDNNNETNVYVEDRRLGDFWEKYFEQIWLDSSAEPKLNSLKLPGIKTVINREHFGALCRLLDFARHKIHVLVYGMNYDERYPDSKPNLLIDSLIRAHRRGVDVKVILDKSDYNQTLNRVNAETRKHLQSGGVEVRDDSEAVTSHAKLVIVDDKAVVGSANWGYDSLEKRNEASLIISEPGTVAFFENYFSRIWEGAPSGSATPVPPRAGSASARPGPTTPPDQDDPRW